MGGKGMTGYHRVHGFPAIARATDDASRVTHSANVKCRFDHQSSDFRFAFSLSSSIFVMDSPRPIFLSSLILFFRLVPRLVV